MGEVAEVGFIFVLLVNLKILETETMTIWTSGYADLFKARNSFSQGLSNTRVTGRIKKGTYREEQHLSFRGKFRVRKTEKVSTARIDGENLKALQDWKRREKK
tara:strand:- start:197 stop:505 length:309 start_codon:yes stop_codon:yes gene_type:complete